MCSNRRSTLNSEANTGTDSPLRRDVGANDDFSPEAQASAGAYYASPAKPGSGARAGAAGSSSPALVNVNAAATSAPAAGAAAPAQNMNYYKAGSTAQPAPAHVAVRQRGAGAAGAQPTKKRFNTQPSPAAGGGRTLIIDDED